MRRHSARAVGRSVGVLMKMARKYLIPGGMEIQTVLRQVEPWPCGFYFVHSVYCFSAPSALSAICFKGALNPRLIGLRSCSENCYPGFLGFALHTKGNNFKLHFYLDIENL